MSYTAGTNLVCQGRVTHATKTRPLFGFRWIDHAKKRSIFQLIHTVRYKDFACFRETTTAGIAGHTCDLAE